MAANESWIVEIEFVRGIWTDVTRYVDTAKSNIFIQQGDTAETTDEGSATFTLNNSDQRFTPGNVLGANYPNVKSGCRIRVREVIGSYNFGLFSGYIEWPEIQAWTASTASAPRDQQITINAVDRMTRLANARPFLSTLGEHILYRGGTRLSGYWPLLASQGYNPYGPAQLPFIPFRQRASSPVVPTGEPAIGFTGSAIDADDVATLRLEPNVVGTDVAVDTHTYGLITPVTVTNNTFTISFWVYLEDVSTANLYWNAGDTVGATLLRLSRVGGAWGVEAGAGPVSSFATVNALPTYKWTLVSIRMTLPSGLIEYWVNEATPVTVTMSGGVVPSTATFPVYELGVGMQGNLAHAQLYVGDFTRQHHLDQYQMGLTGLEYQTTGQRIRTVMAYAGVLSTDLTRVDQGVSVMQVASLAGKTPATAAAEASDTERGSLYAAGDGQIVFAGRQRLLNI